MLAATGSACYNMGDRAAVTTARGQLLRHLRSLKSRRHQKRRFPASVITIRRFLVGLLLLGGLGGLGGAPSAQAAPLEQTTPPLPITTAKAGIVVEYPSGRILYAKNPHKRLPMASTTKTMTALLVLQRVAVTDVVTATADDLVGESTMGLSEGESQTVLDTLYGLMLPSGNDAAMVLARHVGVGLSEPAAADPMERFIALMNHQAAQMGLNDSHYVNPHGFDDPDHYSSAYDLASIAWYDLHNPIYNTIIDQSFHSVPGHGLINTNELLTRYPGADGVKTGMTDAAGNCLVSSATHDGRRLISVTLGEPYGHTYPDTIAMLDYGFAQPASDNAETLIIAERAQLLGYLAAGLPTPLPPPRPTTPPSPSPVAQSFLGGLLPQAPASQADAAAIRAGTRPAGAAAATSNNNLSAWIWSLLAVPFGALLLLVYRRRNATPATATATAQSTPITMESVVTAVPIAAQETPARSLRGQGTQVAKLPTLAPRRPNLLGDALGDHAARAVALAYRGQEGSSLAEFMAVVKGEPEFSFADVAGFYDMPAGGYLALARAYLQVDRPRYAAALLRLGQEAYPTDRPLARLLTEIEGSATANDL